MRPYGGPAFTLGLLALLEGLRRGLGLEPHPALLYLAVVFSTFQGGLLPGLASAGMCVAYACWATLDTGLPPDRFSEARTRLLAVGVGAPLIAAAVAALRRRDAEERRRLEEQVRRAQRMEAVGKLAGGLAHEFNNLLTVILNTASFLRSDGSLPAPAREELDRIRRSAERGSALSRQLLVLASRQPVQARPISLNALLSEMEPLLRRTLGERIVLELGADPALRAVKADPGQLEHVVLNLVANARDAMPEGGRLEVSTSNAADGRVLLRIRDSGQGMPPEVLSKAFEPFFTTKGGKKGTGLGLPVVYAIVSRSGGEISLDSAPGRGTEVSIRLPGTDEPVPAAAPVQAPAGLAVPGGSVLVVEDEDGVRQVVRRALEYGGYRVAEARSAEEALGLLAKEPFDLLLSDVVMPGRSGISLAEEAAGDRPRLRVLLMTGYAPDPEAGGFPVLEKPFTEEALLARVGALLGRMPA